MVTPDCGEQVVKPATTRLLCAGGIATYMSSMVVSPQARQYSYWSFLILLAVILGASRRAAVPAAAMHQPLRLPHTHVLSVGSLRAAQSGYHAIATASVLDAVALRLAARSRVERYLGGAAAIHGCVPARAPPPALCIPVGASRGSP
jgi:hypothetical protein